MASVASGDLDKATHDELCCTYASLLLFDAGLEVSADAISGIISASGNQVAAHCPALFAQVLKGKDIGALLAGVGSGGPATGSGGAGATEAAAEVKEEAPVEEEEEEEDDFGFDLFG